jgi:hypothetical protein
MSKCYRCGDKGEYGGCPECGKNLSMGGKGAVAVTTEILDKHIIPHEYADVQWDTRILESTHQYKMGNPDFAEYCKQLEKIFRIYQQGEIPQQSAIIIAERGMGKMTLGYICMRYALSHGYTVCPMLDNTQIKRISELSSDRPTSYALYRQPYIEDILYSDVLFMTVDKDKYSTALRTIESIMDKRARVGNSTIVLTRFGLDVMSQFEKKGSYLTLQEPTRKFNNKKFPSIIQCR